MLAIVPLLVISALTEVAGVAAVIPFLSLLVSPGSFTFPAWFPGWASAFGDAEASTMLRAAGALLAAVLVLANVLVVLTNWWLLRFSSGLIHAISSRLLGSYLSQPYAFILQRNTAELANRVVVEVRNLVDRGVRSALEILTRAVVIAALITFLVLLDPLIAVVAFVTLGGLYALIFAVARRYLRRIGHEAVVLSGLRLKALNEAIGGFKDLRMAGREAAALDQFVVPSLRYAQVQAAALAVSGLPRYALEAVAVGGLVLIAALVSGRGNDVGGVLPLLGAYAFAGLRLMPAMQGLFSAAAQFRFATGSLDAVEDDLRLVDGLEPLSTADPEALPFERSIEIRDAIFAYPSWDEPALAGVTIAIERHRSVAIVGRTGAGKTTLVDVLLGLLHVQSGSLLLDGRPVAQEQRRAYRALFGYVPQSIYLLDDTIARNVAFGLDRDRIDMNAVERACREAQIADFIEGELPDGYQTTVGERGVRLSGGQRQRIGIARALYHQPEVLVFDEATSALDVHTEQQVYRALEGIARHRTLVTVAHRLETVAKADHVVVLDHGRVVDEGPPSEVLARYRGAMDGWTSVGA